MPEFTTAPIESQEQWNLVLDRGECCPMPEPPGLLAQRQVVIAHASISWVAFQGTAEMEPFPDFYRGWKYVWSGGGENGQEELAPYVMILDDVEIESSNVVDFGPGGTGTPTYVTFALIDVDATRDAAFARAETDLDWDTMGSTTSPGEASGLEATRLNFVPFLYWLYPGSASNAILTAYFVRFRFFVPESHTGTYYRVDWDYLDTPGDADPFLSSEGHTWTWTGPGDTEDPDSWASPWQVIPMPAKGTRRVVNLRVWSYSGGTFGVRPSFVGERFPAAE